MTEVFPLKTGNSSHLTIMNILSQVDPRVALLLGGMICLTAIVSVGCVVLSGDEMNLSLNGFSISTPDKSK